jgi:hypothetical protein
MNIKLRRFGSETAANILHLEMERGIGSGTDLRSVHDEIAILKLRVTAQNLQGAAVRAGKRDSYETQSGITAVRSMIRG